MIVQVIQRNSGQRGISYFYDTGLSITVDAEAEDLINAIQSRFGIVITNAEAEEIRTPAQLIDLITTKVTLVDSPRCLSQLAFHLIRRAAIDNFRLPRLSITPGAELDRIVPNKHRYI